MQDSIREIVKTYNLPSRINSLVLRIAYRNIGILGLTSFSDQYRYISDLVDRFQASREDRNAVSLDSPIKGDGRTWHDVLSYGKSPYEDEETGLTLGRSVDISDRFLVERHKQITHRLLGESNAQNITDLTTDELFADFFGISLRSEAVARYLERGGRIYPERRMIYVNLDSENPWIQWGRRNYNGNPLDYFRRHKDVYGEMSRIGLFRFDHSLYVSLRKHTSQIEGGSVVRQLEIAIPESQGVPWLSEEDKNKIIIAHGLYDKNASEAARHLGFSSETVCKYWRKNNLHVLGRGESNGLSNQKREKVLGAYEKCDGNAKRAAELLGYSRATIVKYWKEHGLKPRGYGIPFQHSKETVDSVLGVYESNNGNALITAKQLSVGRTTVKNIWNRYGLKPRGKGGWNARKQKIA